MRYFVLLLPAIVFFCLRDANAQEKHKAMQSFRSELWQREYRTEEKKDDKNEIVLDDQAVSGDTKATAPKGVIPEEGGEISSLPGQMGLDELRESTPLAEWQVDSGADRPMGDSAFRSEASAWQLSRARTEESSTAEMAEGPTITTYLVGFMACIVVVGALITGRES